MVDDMGVEQPGMSMFVSVVIGAVKVKEWSGEKDRKKATYTVNGGHFSHGDVLNSTNQDAVTTETGRDSLPFVRKN